MDKRIEIVQCKEESEDSSGEPPDQEDNSCVKPDQEDDACARLNQEGNLLQRNLGIEEQRQRAAEQLRDAIARELAGGSREGPADPEKMDSETGTLLWDTLLLYQDVPFVTSKNLQFSYSIRGYEMFVSRKDKSITRSTVNLAFDMVMKLLREDLPISGPKKLGTFGASYLYPVFIQIGVIPPDKTKKKKTAQGNEKTKKRKALQGNEKTKKRKTLQGNEKAEKVRSSQGNEKAEKVRASQGNEKAEKMRASQGNEKAEKRKTKRGNEKTEKVKASQENEKTEKVKAPQENEKTEKMKASQENEKTERVKASQKNKKNEKMEKRKTTRKSEKTE